MLISFLFLVVLGAVHAVIDTEDISYYEPKRFRLVKGESHIFCVHGDNSLGITNWFSSIKIHVSAEDKVPLGWYSVGGVSTDDLHSIVHRWLSSIFGWSHAPDLSSSATSSSSYPEMSSLKFIRELVSSCPTPFSSDTNKCKMSFSPAGRACVRVDAHHSGYYEVHASRSTFNFHLLRNLVLGFMLNLTAHVISKSKIFQFSAGSALFVLGGMAFLLYYMASGMLGPKVSGMTKTFLTFSLGLGYWASIVVFVKKHMSVLVLDYWEFVLAYVLVMAAIGLFCMRSLRSNENIKSGLRLGCKWSLRVASMIFIYNSTASPTGSVILLVLKMAMYAYYKVRKFIRGPRKEKLKRK